MVYRTKSPFSAFSLIEAAIVLALVGLIIGGIWLATKSVQEELKLSKGEAELLTIVNNIQTNMSETDAAALGDATSFHNTAIAAGWIPSNWVSNGQMIAPFGNKTFTYIVNWGPNPRWRFQLGFRYLSQALCIRLSNFIISASAIKNGVAYAYQDGGLGNITVYSYDDALTLVSTNSVSTFSTSVTSAHCTTDKNELYLVWAYTRIN